MFPRFENILGASLNQRPKNFQGVFFSVGVRARTSPGWRWRGCMKTDISCAARPYRVCCPGSSGRGYSRCVRSTCEERHNDGSRTRMCEESIVDKAAEAHAATGAPGASAAPEARIFLERRLRHENAQAEACRRLD